jgi:hypothetical protein
VKYADDFVLLVKEETVLQGIALIVSLKLEDEKEWE